MTRAKGNKIPRRYLANLHDKSSSSNQRDRDPSTFAFMVTREVFAFVSPVHKEQKPNPRVSLVTLIRFQRRKKQSPRNLFNFSAIYFPFLDVLCSSQTTGDSNPAKVRVKVSRLPIKWITRDSSRSCQPQV